MKAIGKIWFRDYPLNASVKQNPWFHLKLSLSIPIVFILIQPFGLGTDICQDFNLVMLVNAVPIFAVFFSTNRFILPILAKNEDDWNVWKEFVWIVLVTTLCIMVSLLYWTLNPYCKIEINDAHEFIFQGVIFSIFPILFYVIASQRYLAYKKEKSAKELNQILEKRLQKYESSLIELSLEKGKVPLKIDEDNLLFIQASENYIEVFIDSQGTIRRSVYRNTLHEIESQIDRGHIFKCHRSFIVNLKKVVRFSGTARGYRLHLDNYTDTIPVSRSKGKVLKQLLNDLPK